MNYIYWVILFYSKHSSYQKSYKLINDVNAYIIYMDRILLGRIGVDRKGEVPTRSTVIHH